MFGHKLPLFPQRVTEKVEIYVVMRAAQEPASLSGATQGPNNSSALTTKPQVPEELLT